MPPQNIKIRSDLWTPNLHLQMDQMSWQAMWDYKWTMGARYSRISSLNMLIMLFWSKHIFVYEHVLMLFLSKHIFWGECLHGISNWWATTWSSGEETWLWRRSWNRRGQYKGINFVLNSKFEDFFLSDISTIRLCNLWIPGYVGPGLPGWVGTEMFFCLAF